MHLLASQAERLSSSLTNRIHRSVVYVDGIASRPLFKDPSTLYSAEMQTIDVFQGKMEQLGKTLTQQSFHSVELASSNLLRLGKALLLLINLALR